MTGRRLAVMLLAVLALLAAGCGGDDSSDASGDTETTVVEETMTEEETTSDDETSEAAGGTGALGESCMELAGIGSKLAQTLSGGKTDLDEASKLFDEIADQVPEEIRDDYEVVAENFGKIADAMKDVDLSSGATPTPEDLAKLQQLSTTLDSAEVQKASDNIQAWAEANC